MTESSFSSSTPKESAITPLRLYDIKIGKSVMFNDIEGAETGKVSYSTVSHVWGPQETSRLPGMGWALGMGAGPVYRKQGRLAAVCQVYPARYLWWDAYCVDQDNDDEASMETHRSASYFRESKRTFALLNDVGYRLLPQLNTLEHQTMWATLVRAGRNQDASTLMGLVPQDLWFEDQLDGYPVGIAAGPLTQAGNLMDMIKLVRDICLDPWFNRVWLIQEMKVATDVILIGAENSTLPLEEFMLGLKGIYILSSRVHLQLGLGGMSLEMRGIWALYETVLPTTIGQALRFASTRACTRFQDRLFATRSLLNNLHAIKVEYTSGSFEKQLLEYFLATGDASFMLFQGRAAPGASHLPDPRDLDFVRSRLWSEPVIGERILDENGLKCTFQLYARVVNSIPVRKIIVSTGLERLAKILQPMTEGNKADFANALQVLQAEIVTDANGKRAKGLTARTLNAHLCKIIEPQNGNGQYILLHPNLPGYKVSPSSVFFCVGPPGLTDEDTLLILEPFEGPDGVHRFRRIGLAFAFQDMPLVTSGQITGYLG
ncbi:hypothetical protein V865_008061 [Kwoniella europaea PYCC6329]|uniref:Heterokaryon incompatibility domain-containing protein n=1 Tax=Kwoniella europaea PYCC6329 TaxID=1423913 RepID=A0AAX4KU71_9TREE